MAPGGDEEQFLWTSLRTYDFYPVLAAHHHFPQASPYIISGVNTMGQMDRSRELTGELRTN